MTVDGRTSQPVQTIRLGALVRALVLMPLLAVWTAAAAQAAGLQVSPLALEFTDASQAEAVWLTNSGTAPIRVQVRVMRWTQADGVETLEPSPDLRPSPAIVEIAPGRQQLVRIVRPRVDATRDEAAYRLFIDELPNPESAPSQGLQFLLRYSIPVFIPPTELAPGEAEPRLTARLTGEGADRRLEVTNHGRKRARLSQIAAFDAAGERHVVVAGLLGYVLAGQRMEWPITLPEGASEGSVEARLNNEQSPQVLLLDRPGR